MESPGYFKYFIILGLFIVVFFAWRSCTNKPVNNSPGKLPVSAGQGNKPDNQ